MCYLVRIVPYSTHNKSKEKNKQNKRNVELISGRLQKVGGKILKKKKWTRKGFYFQYFVQCLRFLNLKFYLFTHILSILKLIARNP